MTKLEALLCLVVILVLLVPKYNFLLYFGWVLAVVLFPSSFFGIKFICGGQLM